MILRRQSWIVTVILGVGALFIADAPGGSGTSSESPRSSIIGKSYQVQRNDTLESIAQKFQMTVEQLKRQLRGPLRPGQTLFLQSPGVADEQSPTRDWIEAHKVQAGETLEDVAQQLGMSSEELGDFNDLAVEYDVQTGDTLATIAKKHETTVERLTDWNDLTAKERVFPGQKLVVGWEAVKEGDLLYYPQRSKAIEAVEEKVKNVNGRFRDGSTKFLNDDTRYEIYTVKAGDTAEKIAKRFSVTAEEIRELNGMASDEEPISGEPLYVPRRAATSQPSAKTQRLSPGQLPVRAGTVLRNTVILQRPGGRVVFRPQVGLRLAVIGYWGNGYAVLMQGGKYGWIDKASVQLGDFIGTTRVTTPPPTGIKQMFQIAYTYLGVPYVFGGNSYKGIDCSGFVKNVFVGAGLWKSSAPRTACTQINVGAPVSMWDLRPGDRVYFCAGRLGAGVADHTGIYIGGGQIIHATPRRVCISNLFSGRLSRIYLGARR